MLLFFLIGLLAGGALTGMIMADKYEIQNKLISENQSKLKELDQTIKSNEKECADDIKQYWKAKRKEMLMQFQIIE